MLNNDHIKTLAIIIPAYKSTYLKQTLDSIAAQTNQDFTVYVGDDCSPSNLEEIVATFRSRIDIRYTRFSNNIGAKNLVYQWRRCVELSVAEPWIWLFSDDDMADPDCVQRLLEVLNQKHDRYDVYRFNTRVIDSSNKLLFNTPCGPEEESSEAMAYHLLKGERGNSMPDHIFKRTLYIQVGGFVVTDFAQGADWASSILFSSEKGIAIIPSAMVSWRYSGSNISSTAGNKWDVAKGHLQFLQWVLNHFQYLRTRATIITYPMIVSAMRINIFNVFVNHYRGLSMKSAVALFKFMSVNMRLPAMDALRVIHQIDVHTKNRLGFLTNWKSKLRPRNDHREVN